MSVSVIPALESSHLASHAPIAKLSISIPLGRNSEQAAVQSVRCGLPPRAKRASSSTSSRISTRTSRMMP
jgi:hypothetical protein